jgi:restriction system protein
MQVEINVWETIGKIIKNTLVLFGAVWPLWLFIIGIVAVRALFWWLDVKADSWHLRRKFKKGEEWRSDQALVSWLRKMDPTEFEKYIAELFLRLGYKTEAVGGSRDGGIDVVAEKDGVRHYIQCKKYFSKHQVGSPEVRDFYGAIAGRLTHGEGWFITTNKFTPEAQKFAEDKPIILINQFKLIEYIRLAEKGGFNSQPKINENLKCPKCEGFLVERESKYGVFYGCSNYPKCKYILNKN